MEINIQFRHCALDKTVSKMHKLNVSSLNMDLRVLVYELYCVWQMYKLFFNNFLVSVHGDDIDRFHPGYILRYEKRCISTYRSWNNRAAIVETMFSYFPFRGQHFQMHFLERKSCALIAISLNFVPRGPYDNKLAWVQVTAWRRTGDKPSSEPMLLGSMTHICSTRERWIKIYSTLFTQSNLQYVSVELIMVWHRTDTRPIVCTNDGLVHLRIDAPFRLNEVRSVMCV